MDTARELRAMTMATFPCPPLPMIGATLHGDEAVVNSHDLLSFLMNTAARRDVQAENEVRIYKQQELYKRYFAALEDGSADLWDTMTRFTREYMMTYTHAMHYLRFVPFDAAPPPIKHQVCSWLAAQHILSGKIDAKAEDFLKMGHGLLYSKCALAVQEKDKGICADGGDDVQCSVDEVFPVQKDVLGHPEENDSDGKDKEPQKILFQDRGRVEHHKDKSHVCHDRVDDTDIQVV